MTTRRWTPRAGAVKQINTITPAAVDIGDTFTVTMNTCAVTVTATAGTVANVTALLVAALNASEYGEFGEITWTDSTTHVTGTADTAGVPFTQTSSSVGGTNTTATTQVATGPNYWSNANNWSGATVPIATDDVILDHSDVSVLYGLAQSAVTLTSLTIHASYTGDVGLAETNTGGGGDFTEYRDTFLAISATTLTVGEGEGQGSRRIKIDTGTVQTAVVVRRTSGGAETGLPALCWKGTHASNTVQMTGGEFGAAVFGGEAATILTLRVGATGDAAEALFKGGAALTLTTLNQQGGTVELMAGLTTVTKLAGTLTILAGNVTTLTDDDGTTNYLGVGTIGTLNVGTDATLDFGADMRGCVVTNANLYSGCTVNDPFGRVTWSNAFRTVRCDLGEVTLRLGAGKAYLPSA